MRDIEFRAWDNDLECYPIQIYTFTNHNPRYNLEQFTGVLDKDGKKTFEGDIVRSTCPLGDKVDGEVKWQGTGNIGWVVYVQSRFQPYPLNTGNRYEVLGNIHENPELLEFSS